MNANFCSFAFESLLEHCAYRKKEQKEELWVENLCCTVYVYFMNILTWRCNDGQLIYKEKKTLFLFIYIKFQHLYWQKSFTSLLLEEDIMVTYSTHSGNQV